MSHDLEVVESAGACCANELTLDHFCGNGSLLKKDMRSRCNKCEEEVPAEAWRSNDNPPRVYLRKYCPTDGVTSSRLSSDAAFYYVADSGQACGCGPGWRSVLDCMRWCRGWACGCCGGWRAARA